ncbi:MAG: hypothetical protein HC772_10285 [Leptolyngbyaceae cyanobacterium CRU_2_3]|nr:hypothetical protein [Leptolyngbyaceae cyanobacterium CRU_2_3]
MSDDRAQCYCLAIRNSTDENGLSTKSRSMPLTPDREAALEREPIFSGCAGFTDIT